MAILLAPRQVSMGAAPSPTLAPGMPDFTVPSTTLDDTAAGNHGSKMSPGTLALAIIAPILFIAGLVWLSFYTRRRMSASRLNNGQVTASSSSPPISAGGTSAGTPTTNSTSETRESQRDARRARRLRRTESGTTIKTLPEYNELGEDEILLSKSMEAPSTISRNTSQNREARAEESGETVSRRTSLTAVLRRLSLRRSEPEPSTEDESNEMEDMIERATLDSTNEDDEQRMSPVREEQALSNDDTPEYDQLYPTLPPRIQVDNADADADLENQHAYNANTSSSLPGRRTRALRNMFRRQATSLDTTPQRNAGLYSAGGGELGLTLTQSNDYSLYRPSTSSSRPSLPFGGSSISLLSQSGNDSSDTLGRNTLPRRHLRNISAPISTRRLQLAAPIAGFSDQQMQFLTSVESLDRYGVPVDGAVVERQELPPPSFEELAREEERLQQPASRHLAPILTSAEIVARHEQSPLSPSLPSRQHSLAEASETTTTTPAHMTTT